MLIPGAGSDSWYWHLVAPELAARGHDVVTPDLPCDDDAAGLAEYTDVVVDAIGDRRDLVLVAQSMGAFTARARVRPGAGRPAGAGGGHDARGRARPAGSGGPTPGQAEAQRAQAVREGRDPDDDSPETIFLHDVPPDVAAESAHHVRAAVRHALLDAVAAGRRGRTCPPGSCCAATTACSRPTSSAASSRERLGLVPDEMDGGHLPALAHPHELVERLESFRTEALASATDPRRDLENRAAAGRVPA